MAQVRENPHALVVPATGLGHVNSCMLLAKSLVMLGFDVSFVYYSSEYAKVKEKMPLAHSAGSDNGSSACTSSNGSTSGMLHIHVVEDAFAPEDLNKLFFVTPTMKDNLYNLVLQLQEQGDPPTCLISDTFTPWTLHIAQRAGIPRVEYLTSTAMSYLHAISLSSLFSKGIFPEKGSRPTPRKREDPLMLDHVPGLPPFSSELYPQELRFADSSDYFVRVTNQISSCMNYGERILIHTISELEPTAFQVLHHLLGTPTYAIGPLLQYSKNEELEKKKSGSPRVLELDDRAKCMSWLDMHPNSSVIYIAFGSSAILSLEDILELAMGLELSGISFLWVIREGSHALPHTITERISVKGMIISWAPQVEVLAHKAIGGFLTHCGWNSTLESLWAGVPMLCCPQFGDQMLNSHYICDVWGVGLELKRTIIGGLERQNVELGVKTVMQSEEGLKASAKAQELMHLAKKTCQQGGQSFTNLQKFYDDMRILCSRVSSNTLLK